MKGIKRKEDGRRKRLAVFFGLLVLLGLLLNSLDKVYQKKKEAEKALSRMEEQKAELRNRSEELQNTLSRLQTKEGLDLEIRKRFNVAAAGEQVAIIVEPETTTPPETRQKTWWQKVISLFPKEIEEFFTQ
jgi:cell division protein FtsB